MSGIPDDIKIARSRAALFEAAVHKQFPRYVDVCTINDALDHFAAERHRHTNTISRLLKLATHSSTCGHRFGHDCDCGLQDLRTANGDCQ